MFSGRNPALFRIGYPAFYQGMGVSDAVGVSLGVEDLCFGGEVEDFDVGERGVCLDVFRGGTVLGVEI